MDDKEHNRFIDDLLDASLSRYGSATPRPGLDVRILANVRSDRQHRSWLVWAGGLAVGALAAVIVVGALALMRLSTPPAPPAPVVADQGVLTGPSSVSPPVQPPRAPHRTPLLLAHQAAVAAPKPADAEPRTVQFPSPQPPTDQERLLVQYVRETPAPALSAVLTASAAIPDLEIKELTITPLANEETETPN